MKNWCVKGDGSDLLKNTVGNYFNQIGLNDNYRLNFRSIKNYYGMYDDELNILANKFGTIIPLNLFALYYQSGVIDKLFKELNLL